MSFAGKSFEKVQYEFRPAKQVERRMLLHTLQSMMSIGFPICDYRYTGLGSIYFVDFIMFHKYLGINRFLSVELNEGVKRRVFFNRPFSCIEIGIGDVADYIPELSPDEKHILWLDYDCLLTSDVLEAVHLAATQLSPGSILLVTVDVEPPGRSEDGPSRWNPKAWRKYYISEAGRYIWSNNSVSDFARGLLPATNTRLLEAAIIKGINGRKGVHYFPLFNFSYADGHRMLSLGGMIGTEPEGRALKSLDKNTLHFLRPSLQARSFEIVVPNVTRKERHVLDSSMPCRSDWLPKEFEFAPDKVEAYRKIYRYYPGYGEMLL